MTCRWLVYVWPKLFFAIGLLAISTIASAGENNKYASLVIDAYTGKVLKASSADSQRYPASLTKIMTLYVVFEELAGGRLKLTTPIKFSKHAVGQPPSKLGVKLGKTITIDTAIRALVTKSANDVAAAIAEHISGTESAFAQRMTKTALRLGMSKSTFRNASGLPDNAQKTTARDMVTLARRIMSDYPERYKLFSLKSFTWRGRTYRNHNQLLGRYAGTDGIKTGYIRASGFNLVASVRRQNKHLIAAVFGGKTARRRDAHMKALLDQALPKAVARSERAVTDNQRIASAGPLPPRAKPQLSSVASPPIDGARVNQTSDRSGTITLSLVATPPRSRELPIAMPESRINKPSYVVASSVLEQSAVPAAIRSDMEPASRISAGSAWRSGAEVAAKAAPAPPPPSAAYAPLDQNENPADTIERLISEAIAPNSDLAAPVEIATGQSASRLILPSLNPADQTVEQARSVVAASTPGSESIDLPDGWQIQVGAYARPSDAHVRLAAVENAAPGLLADATAFTQPVEKGKNTLYRARFAGLEKGTAELACRTLKKKKIPCLVFSE